MNVFLEDDYFSIVKKYFSFDKDYFNPARIEPSSIAKIESFLPNLNNDTLVQYHNDDTSLGQSSREVFANLISETAGLTYTPNEVTLAPSITSASLLVIEFLKREGIENIWVETPCYYATILQFECLRMDYRLIPTYLESGFSWNTDKIDLKKGKQAIWITHPRISLSMSQTLEKIILLCKLLERDNGFLIVDEATEISTHGLFSAKELLPYRERIIRLKSIFKPFGINGPRIASILHPERYSENLKRWTWTFHGGIDAMSIKILKNLNAFKNDYKMLGEVTTRQITECYNMANRMTKKNESIAIVPYSGGYTAVLILKLFNKKVSIESFLQKREKLILTLEGESVFPTLGASMHFAYDGMHEFLRINYLTNRRKLESLILFLMEYLLEAQ